MSPAVAILIGVILGSIISWFWIGAIEHPKPKRISKKKFDRVTRRNKLL